MKKFVITTSDGVEFSIPFKTIDFLHSISFGLEAIVSGKNPEPQLNRTLQFLSDEGLIRSLNLSEKHFAFRVVQGFVR